MDPAFRRFFDEWYPRLVLYLRARLGDEDHAEDVAQKAFVRLLDCVVLYDDIDRSRSFTCSDAIRYISRPESFEPLAEPGPRHDHDAELLAMFNGGR
jgi:hypothetical protein